ncbi:MAG: polysaccharide deacetylase family protein, partial [Candidatus Rokuibacteriota bacterium]
VPTAPPVTPGPETARPRSSGPAGAPLPETFESEDFVVTFAKAGDTAAGLAARFLGDVGKAWMVEDHNGAAAFEPGHEVVIPKHPWNLSGVGPTGYQIVPILVYHNLGPQSKGRLTIGVATFEEQMRYLKTQGYRVINLNAFLEFASLRRQLPRKSVVLTFDDGWKPFREFAYPILKELGFTATLFIYTDFVGSRSALSWDEIRQLGQEGFQIEAHSKTHSDLRRRQGESEAEYAHRMQAELIQPLALFQRHLGRTSQILAYPYGAQDDDLLKRLKEHGYAAALTVRRQGAQSFVPLLTIHRSQIYSEMSLEDFAKNLNVFNEEPIR